MLLPLSSACFLFVKKMHTMQICQKSTRKLMKTHFCLLGSLENDWLKAFDKSRRKSGLFESSYFNMVEKKCPKLCHTLEFVGAYA